MDLGEIYFPVKIESLTTRFRTYAVLYISNTSRKDVNPVKSCTMFCWGNNIESLGSVFSDMLFNEVSDAKDYEDTIFAFCYEPPIHVLLRPFKKDTDEMCIEGGELPPEQLFYVEKLEKKERSSLEMMLMKHLKGK